MKIEFLTRFQQELSFDLVSHQKTKQNLHLLKKVVHLGLFADFFPRINYTFPENTHYKTTKNIFTSPWLFKKWCVNYHY